jgi:uncharacterized membrane protein YcaP (DUF421 family)
MNIEAIFLKVHELTVSDLFFRTTVLYFTLFISAKFMGYRQPGVITPYNFIMAAGVSHIAAVRIINPESRPLDAIVIIIIATMINLLISYTFLKYPPLVQQQSHLLIKNGKVIQSNLSKTNLTIHNLLSVLRQKNVFSPGEADYVIAEATGDFSVLVNPRHSPPTKQTLSISTDPQILPEVLIYKGKIDEGVLRKHALDAAWLRKELAKNNITRTSDVFLAVLQSNKTLYVSC